MKKYFPFITLVMITVISCNSQTPIQAPTPTGGTCDTKEITLKARVDSIDTITNECTLLLEHYNEDEKKINEYYYEGYTLPSKIIIKNNSFEIEKTYNGTSKIYISGSCPPLIEYESALKIDGKSPSLLELYFSVNEKNSHISYREETKVTR